VLVAEGAVVPNGMPSLMGPLSGPNNGTINISYLTDYGVDSLPPFASRAILLDMLAYKAAQDPAYAFETAQGHKALHAGVCITAEDVKAVLAEYKLEVAAGDAVLFYTGWQHVQEDDEDRFISGEPGPDHSAAVYLADKKVWTIGADSWGTECSIPPSYEDDAFFAKLGLPADVKQRNTDLPGATLPDGSVTTVWPVHVELLFTRGIFNLENLDLAAMVADGVREGLFTLGAPKSPTPQAHINPVMLASRRAARRGPGPAARPTTARSPTTRPGAAATQRAAAAARTTMARPRSSSPCSPWWA